MDEFYIDGMYWLVTVDGIARVVSLLEADARRIYDATDPNEVDGDVTLWRLNGGWLCTPHVAIKKVSK